MQHTLPSEFAGFVRDIGKRAFDALGERVKDLEKPLRPLVRSWSKLTEEEKNLLLDELIASVRSVEPEEAARRPVKKKRKRATK